MKLDYNYVYWLYNGQPIPEAVLRFCKIKEEEE
jgi:hypothetical protein